MIEFTNGGRLVERVEELPALRPRRLFLDFETSSGDAKKRSTNPWRDCYVAGFAVTCDDASGAWYVPVGHHYGVRLEWESVAAWLGDLVRHAEEWVNSNVKYDAHVLLNAGVLEFEDVLRLRLLDTATLGKIIDSDRYRYGLEHLALDWLGEDISRYYEPVKTYTEAAKNKDWGAVPPDVMAEYACQDVMTNRRLIRYEEAQRPEQCAAVWDTEVALTSVLVDVERVGMRIDPQAVMIRKLRGYERMIAIEEELAALVGHTFRPHVNEDCHEVLCGAYGLPVLGWTGDEPGEGNPSFDKHALAQYAAHPYAPHDVITLMLEYRRLHTLDSTFLGPYLEQHIDGLLHPTYNQCVRTGRMSCKEPNAQQLSPEAKELIVPANGDVIASWDYSQIEFRTIVHYIKNQRAIDAYNLDPDTDFHVWVAEMCVIKRKPAKSVNFMMGFGGGRKKTVDMLSTNMDLVAEMRGRVDELVVAGRVREDQRIGTFELLCKQRAMDVYNRYHRELPELKRCSASAARSLVKKGYVFNLRGRHRHLPTYAAHKAFNSLNQSSAADIMKERTVALWRALRGTPIRIFASVHDETATYAPAEVVADPRYERDATAILEATDVSLRVPLRVGFGWSATDWRDAGRAVVDGGTQRPATRDVTGAAAFDWLR